jgi:hypothetical protein
MVTPPDRTVRVMGRCRKSWGEAALDGAGLVEPVPLFVRELDLEAVEFKIAVYGGTCAP